MRRVGRLGALGSESRGRSDGFDRQSRCRRRDARDSSTNRMSGRRTPARNERRGRHSIGAHLCESKSHGRVRVHARLAVGDTGTSARVLVRALVARLGIVRCRHRLPSRCLVLIHRSTVTALDCDKSELARLGLGLGLVCGGGRSRCTPSRTFEKKTIQYNDGIEKRNTSACTHAPTARACSCTSC